MLKKDVVLGKTYVVKVSGKISKVRLDAESPFGGWVGTNVATKRTVRIKSAARLRGLVTAPAPAPAVKPELDQLIERVKALPPSEARDAALDRAGLWLSGAWVAASCGKGWKTPFEELRALLES